MTSGERLDRNLTRSRKSHDRRWYRRRRDFAVEERDLREKGTLKTLYTTVSTGRREMERDGEEAVRVRGSRNPSVSRSTLEDQDVVAIGSGGRGV